MREKDSDLLHHPLKRAVWWLTLLKKNAHSFNDVLHDSQIELMNKLLPLMWREKKTQPRYPSEAGIFTLCSKLCS